MNTLRTLFNCTRNYLASRIRSLALCCLLNHLSLTTGRRPRPSRYRSFRLAHTVLFNVALCLLKAAKYRIQKPETCRATLLRFKFLVDVSRFSPCRINLLRNKSTKTFVAG